MSETDIYTNKQRLPQGKNAKPKRRRRSQPRQFDAKRKRRSKNRGFRRLFHLIRKEENEKAMWTGFAVLMAILLAVVGAWQFWGIEYFARIPDEELTASADATIEEPVANAQTNTDAPPLAAE